MATWVTDGAVGKELEAGDEAPLRVADVPYCISPDRLYCVLAREHSAWQVEGEGWRDANHAPEPGERGRWALNFYKAQRGSETGSWLKTLIPWREGRVRPSLNDDESCTIQGDATEIRLTFARIDGLLWDLMVGHAQTEDDVERAYGLVGDG